MVREAEYRCNRLQEARATWREAARVAETSAAKTSSALVQFWSASKRTSRPRALLA